MRYRRYYPRRFRRTLGGLRRRRYGMARRRYGRRRMGRSSFITGMRF